MKVAPTKFRSLLGRRTRLGAAVLAAVAAALLLGISAAPALAADVDFGNVHIGNVSDTIVGIQSSTGPLNGTVDGDASFSLTFFTCSPQGGPFYFCTAGVEFAPTEAGLKSGTLHTSGGGDYSLSGTGTIGPGASANPYNLEFGQVPVGATAMLSTVVTNNGDEDLSFSLSSSTGGYSFSGCTSTVAPGGNCTLTVTFSPSGQSLYTENVHFVDPNVWGSNDLMLNGEGVLAYQVTSAANSGPGTLRDAITTANGAAGPFAITFAIPGAGVHKIRVQGVLPTVTTSVTIDATSQPGYAGAPLIQLDNRSGHMIPGLDIANSASAVRGLDITGFGTGIRVESAGTATIAANRIGLDTTGATVANNVGVLVLGTGTLIGGDTLADRNLISGNTTEGILISGPSANGNIVSGNLVGTNAAGNAARPNGNFGVAIWAGATGNAVGGTTAGSRNVLAGNGFSGVGIAGAGTVNNNVYGNYIGTNSTATAAIPNGTHGIAISNGASNTIVGGDSGVLRNVISGNTLAGIAIYDTNTSGNSVIGNYIGTARDGATALPNGLMGIAVLSNASGNTIGGMTAGFRNLVSANAGVGILISGPATSGNIVQGNYIGTDRNGGPLGNNGNGVTLYNGANGNTVGGLASGAGNVIKNNTGAGVAVDNTGLPNTAGNSILRNSIDLNGGLGIALLGGANHGQPAPTILSVTTIGGTTTINVTLALASPSTQHRIQIFTSPACDPSGSGEAALFRNGGTTTTNAAGTAVVSIATPALAQGRPSPRPPPTPPRATPRSCRTA